MSSVIKLLLFLFLWQVKAGKLANWLVGDVTQAHGLCEWTTEPSVQQYQQESGLAISQGSPAADSRDTSCKIPTEFTIPISVYQQDDSIFLYENMTVYSDNIRSWVSDDFLAQYKPTHISITGALVFLDFTTAAAGNPSFPNVTRVVEMQFFTSTIAKEFGEEPREVTVSQTNTLNVLVKIPDGCFDSAGMNYFWYRCRDSS